MLRWTNKHVTVAVTTCRCLASLESGLGIHFVATHLSGVCLGVLRERCHSRSAVSGHAFQWSSGCARPMRPCCDCTAVCCDSVFGVVENFPKWLTTATSTQAGYCSCPVGALFHLQVYDFCAEMNCLFVISVLN